ncbi:asparaginase [Psychroflexus lacisalsi]|uniref:Asparaginase n=1 Tax=Psychroflexus lacisalsi TaxID=503928 RepID=A0ABN1K169_9FLAO|nr:asparaginase [Psychroflexus lacisalsi]MBZ9620783.1 asparaginase [Psychroflexus lacisalsi]
MSKILLVYTGGTIGMIKNPETGALTAFNFDELLSNIPELKLLEHEISTVSFEKPVDSSDMDTTDYVKLANLIEENFEDYDGFVVLHGSDTMSYTASVISFMFENLKKPIIFTGSQLPIGDLRTDAKENLITSIQLAGLKEQGKTVIKEVGLYFEYKLYRANRTTKVNAEHFEAFESANFPPIAESGVNLKINYEKLLKPNMRKKMVIHKSLNDNILILKLFPGINYDTLHHIFNTPHVEGIILETFGSGNAKTDKWFVDLLKDLVGRGVYVVNVTQCVGGGVLMGKYAASEGLKRLGIISGGDITTEAAVGKMMYLLNKNLGPKVFKTIFETSLRGEMN